MNTYLVRTNPSCNSLRTIALVCRYYFRWKSQDSTTVLLLLLHVVVAVFGLSGVAYSSRMNASGVIWGVPVYGVKRGVFIRFSYSLVMTVYTSYDTCLFGNYVVGHCG